jgi:tRNA 2-selenouridine synthase
LKELEKNLGGQHVKTAFELIDSDDAEAAASIALHYYDKAYLHGLQNKDTKDIQYFAY